MLTNCSTFIRLAAVLTLVASSSASALTVYDTKTIVGGSNEASEPFKFSNGAYAPRSLEFITLDQDGVMELDGIGYSILARGVVEGVLTPVTPTTTIEFWSGVTPEGPDPLAGATSLGSISITSAERTNNAFLFITIAEGLADTNDIFLPGNTLLGVEFSYADQNGPDSPQIGPYLSTPAATSIGAPFSTTYYVDDEADGFDAGDLLTKPEGKVMRLQIFTEDIPAIDGDYNGDGTVDLADYTVWRDSLGQSIALPGDTTPGAVSIEDYSVWKTNFGSSLLPAAISVPEPITAGILSVGIFLGFVNCRRRREVC